MAIDRQGTDLVTVMPLCSVNLDAVRQFVISVLCDTSDTIHDSSGGLMPVLSLLASGQIRNTCDQWRVIHSASAQRRATKQTEGDATTQRPSARVVGCLTQSGNSERYSIICVHDWPCM